MFSFVPVKPNLAAIQTAFTGRLYSWDLFSLYRAVSGQYATYPSILAGGIGLSVQQDVLTFVGALGPFGRFHYLGDIYSVLYNNQIQRDLRPLELVGEGFWSGWERFTQLLREDAAEVGEPPKFPGLTYTLPKVEFDAAGLSVPDQFIYAIYRGDVDSMEVFLALLTRYMPETVATIPLFYRDLEGIFSLYAEWARGRFLGEQASAGARVMTKVILLANYRWYLLTGDLLAMVEPIFQQEGFSSGISRVGALIRGEAEQIRVAGR
ncbi:hypothetical protein LCGC14_1311230 [marine sediment metagenome]|uniref:Uncharacterized protein n=1 Tax=marine sediment metagenome TaxID=412755 RepID=A0A0F9L7D0_9ZZZZ